jgi:Zn-dependent peptidase ImmA (M78 family)
VREERGSPSGFAIYLNKNDGSRRQRFTLAHEIAHYILHRDLIGDGLIDDALYRSRLSNLYERQANRFAAEVLMPAPVVRNYFQAGMREPRTLAIALNVSEAAVRIRLEELKLAPVPAA